MTPAYTRRAWIRAAASAAAVPWLAPGAQAAALDEQAVKAAFVYNFMLFTQWPGVLPDPVRLCVLAGNGLTPYLKQLEGRTLTAQNTLSVVTVRPGEPLEPCQALYLDDAQRQHAEPLVARLRGQPVLTVSDSEGLAERGAMIEIARRDLKLGFEVNLEAAARSKLQFSSRMLKLARHVSAAPAAEAPGR